MMSHDAEVRATIVAVIFAFAAVSFGIADGLANSRIVVSMFAVAALYFFILGVALTALWG